VAEHALAAAVESAVAPANESAPARSTEPKAATAAKPINESAGKALSKAGVVAIAGALLGVTAAVEIVKISSRPPAPLPAASSQPSSPAPPAQAPVQAQAQPPAQTKPPAPAQAPKDEAPKDADVKGEIAFQAQPEVPPAIAGKIQGHIRVSVRVQVDTEGNVAQATIDTSGPSQYFAKQALNAARKWKFRPAWIGGRTAASEWILHFQFGPDQTTVQAVEESP
jgi:protein TonB